MISLGTYRYRLGTCREGVIQYVRTKDGQQLAGIQGKALETCVTTRLRNFRTNHRQFINRVRSVVRRHYYAEHVGTDVQ